MSTANSSTVDPHSGAKYRPFTFGVTRATLRESGGNQYLAADQALGPYAHRMTDKLVYWAAKTPDRGATRRWAATGATSPLRRPWMLHVALVRHCWTAA